MYPPSATKMTSNAEILLLGKILKQEDPAKCLLTIWK